MPYLHQITRMGLMNAYLVEEDDGLTLVDTAMGAKKAILKGLKDLYDGIQDFDVLVEGNTVQVFFTEGEFVIPATRLSDGTIRFLALMAVLLHPQKAPLVCIEEPELGLHPDALAIIAELLVEAKEKTQVIVTTHSDALVDGLTSVPETVVVCEKRGGSTQMCRKTSSELTMWLKDYGLGQLWRRGEIGGNRW